MTAGRERVPRFRVYDGRPGARPGCQERFVVYEVDPPCRGVTAVWSAPSLEELELRAVAEGADGRFEKEIWGKTGEWFMGLGNWGPSGRFLDFGTEEEER